MSSYSGIALRNTPGLDNAGKNIITMNAVTIIYGYNAIKMISNSWFLSDKDKMVRVQVIASSTNELYGGLYR